MKSILYSIICLLLSPLFLCCQSEEETHRLSKAERLRLWREDSAALKIGVLPTEDCLPIIVAKELRLYDTLGVSVHLRRYRAMSECRFALEHSMVEGAVIDSTLMATLNSGEAWLQNGLSTGMTWQFLTAKKARISRLEQLSDKIIAADSHGESRRLAESAIDSLLKKNQLVFIVQVEDLDIRLDMLNSGNVDAALLPEPFATKARKHGAKVIDRVRSRPAGVLAMRTKAMQDTARKRQYGLFLKAVAIAKDSIRRYGTKHYTKYLE